MFAELPVLFFNPWLGRRADRADASDPAGRFEDAAIGIALE